MDIDTQDELETRLRPRRAFRPTRLCGKLRQLLAANIRRNELGLSQEELAHKAKLHRTYLGMVVRCERSLSVDNIEKIAKALEVEPSRLLSER